MNIVILGGNSPAHKQWIRDLGAHLESDKHNVFLHDYKHWNSGDESADIEYEIRQVGDKFGNLTDCLIIAKSVGTVIATLAVAHSRIKPTKTVLLGIPIDGVAGETEGFAASFYLLPETQILQNQHDPYGSSSGIENFLGQHGTEKHRLHIIDNVDTHDYQDFDLISELVVQDFS